MCIKYLLIYSENLSQIRLFLKAIHIKLSGQLNIILKTKILSKKIVSNFLLFLGVVVFQDFLICRDLKKDVLNNHLHMQAILSSIFISEVQWLTYPRGT